jgi:cytochrome P450
MSAVASLGVPTIPPLDPARVLDVDLFGQDIKADPSRWFQQWATQPPFYVMIHGRPNAVICSHEHVKWAFTDNETISVVPQPGWGADYLDYFNGLPIITEANPPEHTRLRRLMQPVFTPRRVAQFQDGVNVLTEKAVSYAADKGEFDLMTEMAQPLVYQLLLGSVFEFPVEDWAVFTKLSDAFELVGTVVPGAPKPQAYLDAFKAGLDYCGAVIAQRRREPKDDLVGNIVSAHDVGGVITTEELFTTLISLFTAGLGTVPGSVGLSLLRLCRYPDQLKLLQDDPSLLNSAIEECLRIDSLGNFRHRYVVKDCVVGGVPLYRGMIVHISMGAANYDPALYPEPNRFDITRNPKDIITFGYGTHFCVGHMMARAVLRTLVGRLVQRFPNIRLANPEAKIIYGGMPTERMPLHVQLRID